TLRRLREAPDELARPVARRRYLRTVMYSRPAVGWCASGPLPLVPAAASSGQHGSCCRWPFVSRPAGESRLRMAIPRFRVTWGWSPQPQSNGPVLGSTKVVETGKGTAPPARRFAQVRHDFPLQPQRFGLY